MLVGLSGLQELTLHLTGQYLETVLGRAHHWNIVVESLVHVKPSKKFLIYLPWSEDDCAKMAEGRDYPFIMLPITISPNEEPAV